MKKVITFVALMMVMVMAASMLVACGGVDFDAAEAALEDAGYYVQVIGEEECAEEFEGATRALFAMDFDYTTFEGELVMVIEFSDKDSMNAAMEDLEELSEYYEEDYETELVFKTTGSCFVFGTEAAVDIVL